MNAELLHGFYLGDLLVEPLKGQVTGRSGSAHLAPKAVEVLLCLVKTPGEIVARETLLDEVWGVGHGSQEALSHSVSEIRHALNDHADDPHFIQTLPKRGYRLLVTPEVVSESTSSVVPGAEHVALLSDIGFFENLQRRGVLETTVAYLIIGWLIIQVADIVFSQLHLPDIAGTFVTVLVIAGFPIALVLSWFLDFRDGRAVLHDLSPLDARKRSFSRTYLSVIGALGIASLMVFAYDQSIGLPEAEIVRTPAELPTELPPIVENSFAVLPFLNIDGSDETQIFANGLHEDLINRLTRIPDLRVSSRGDSSTLSANSPSTQVRQRLRVQQYLVGSVETIEDKMRITVQMIDTESGFHIVSRTFDHERDDFFDVRDEITSVTVANVRVALPPGLHASSLQVAEDPSVDAYVLYRRGIDVSRQPRTVDTISVALGWFDAALAVDDEYAAAHAGKCATYVLGYTEVDDASFIANAESECATALALNPNLVMVHSALGDLYYSTGRHIDAELAYQKALDVDPSSVEALTGLGRTYQRLNRPDEAEASLRKAVDIHPGDWNAFNRLGVFMFQTGRFDEAAVQYQYVVALEPENMQGFTNLASAYMMQGDFALAAPAFQKAIELEPTTNAYSNLGLMHYYLGDLDAAIDSLTRAVELQPNDYLAKSNLGDALWTAGRKRDARRIFAEAKSIATEALQVNPNDPFTMMDLAWIDTALAEHDEARSLIDRAMELAPDDPYGHYINGLILNRSGDATGAITALQTAVDQGYSIKLLAGDPNLSNLNQDSRFAEILEMSK